MTAEILRGTKKVKKKVDDKTFAKGGSCGRRKQNPRCEVAKTEKLTTTVMLNPKRMIRLRNIDKTRKLISFSGFRNV